MRSLLARATGALLTGILLVLGIWGPAHASNDLNIDHVSVDESQVAMLLSVDGIGDTEVTTSNLSVTVDGVPVDATIKTAAAGEIERATMLVLDTSNSMAKGDRIGAATDAVRAYLDATPADIEVGLVTFAGKVKEVLRPSADRSQILEALDDVDLTPGTKVYDAIDAAVAVLDADGARSLLVLSDGADTGSVSTLEVTSGGAADAEVVVDVVSLQDPDQAKSLSLLAEQTGGNTVPSDPAALSQVLTAQGAALSRQLVVSFSAPDDAASEVTIDVVVTSADTSFADSAFISLGASSFSAPNVVKSGEALIGTPGMLIGSVALALGLAGLLATGLTSATGGRSTSTKRLDDYFRAGNKSSATNRNSQRATNDFRGSAVAMAERVVSADLETRIAQRLTGAGSALTASEWVLLHAAIAVGSAFMGFVLGGGAVGAIALVLGVLGPWLYLKFRHGRRLKAFTSQLAETLGLVAGGLQAGLSLPQAIDSVVREGNEPMAGELRRALVEQRLGVDISDALEGVGERMDSEDFSWIVMAIRIQREVGGNLAEILHTVADTLREREYLRRQVRALSAEGRMSAWILGALPVALFFYMLVANRPYVSVLYTTLPGYILLALAMVLLGIGTFAMAKLVKVEV